MTIPINRSHGTVLYVDREESASKYICQKFAPDYDILFAHCATVALQYLHDSSRHIDVIVTDDRLPDDAESSLLLQAIEVHPYIECILVTADAPRELILEQKRQGRTWEVLEKPVDLDEVGIAILAAVGRSMRRQMRCQRFEAIANTVRFFGDRLTPHYAAVGNLCEQILDPDPNNAIDKYTLRQDANIVLSGMKKLRDETVPCFRSALRNTGHSVAKDETRTTASKLITDILSKMPLSQDERSCIRLEVRDDFPIPKTAALMDLVLTNVFIAALASVRHTPRPHSIGISVLIEGTPQIIISDSGAGTNVDNVAEDDLNPLLAPEGKALKLCSEVMTFLGGTLLITTFPVGESQILLEFPSTEESGFPSSNG